MGPRLIILEQKSFCGSMVGGNETVFPGGIESCGGKTQDGTTQTTEKSHCLAGSWKLWSTPLFSHFLGSSFLVAPFQNYSHVGLATPIWGTQSLSKYLLSIYYIPGPIQSVGGTAVKKTKSLIFRYICTCIADGQIVRTGIAGAKPWALKIIIDIGKLMNILLQFMFYITLQLWMRLSG